MKTICDSQSLMNFFATNTTKNTNLTNLNITFYIKPRKKLHGQ